MAFPAGSGPVGPEPNKPHVSHRITSPNRAGNIGYDYIHLGSHPVSGITQVLRWNEEAGRVEAVRCGDFQPIGLHEDQSTAPGIKE